MVRYVIIEEVVLLLAPDLSHRRQVVGAELLGVPVERDSLPAHEVALAGGQVGDPAAGAQLG